MPVCPLMPPGSIGRTRHRNRRAAEGWGHTCRAIWNAALVQRQILWRERRWTLRSARQCGEHTEARAAFEWVADLPGQCAQQILRAMDQAYDNWWNPQHPADAPALRKRGTTLSVSFPGQAVTVEKLNRKWAKVRLPKFGPVRFRLSRALGGTVRNATVSVDALGWHVSFGIESDTPDAPANGLPGVGIDFGVKVAAYLSDEDHGRVMAPTSAPVSRDGCSRWNSRRHVKSPMRSGTTVASTPAGSAAPSPRSRR